jgi:chromosome segregation ATPase
MSNDIIKKAQALAANAQKAARKTLIQQQDEIEPADPGALAEMQVKNLDKFAKKLKKQYQDAKDQNIDAEKEIKFIDSKLAELKKKYSEMMNNLEFRQKERDRMHAKLTECAATEHSLMTDVKNRVNINKHQMSSNFKAYAFSAKEQARGFPIGQGSTCTMKEYHERKQMLKRVADERKKYIATLKTKGAAGDPLMSLNGSQSMKGLLRDNQSSVKSLPPLRGSKSRNGSSSGMVGSKSTPVL